MYIFFGALEDPVPEVSSSGREGFSFVGPVSFLLDLLARVNIYAHTFSSIFDL